MTIKLDDRFTITSDTTSFSLNYTPEKKEDSKSDKEPTPRAVGHYGDLQSALIGYIKNEMRSKEIDLKVSEIIHYIKTLEGKIIKASKETK